MNRRICPKCNNYLGNNDYYFCSSCGNVLEADSVKQLDIIKSYKYDSEETSIYTRFHSILTLLRRKEVEERLFLGAAAVLVIIGLVVFFKLSGGLKSINSTLSPSKNNIQKAENIPVNAVDLPNIEQKGTFGSDNFYYFVPEGMDAIAEGFFYGQMVEQFFKESPYYLLLKESEKYVDNHFILFTVKKGDYWELTAVLLARDKVKAAEMLKEVNVAGLKSKLIDDKIILSTSDAVLEEVESAKSGNSKNLTLDPRYASIKSKLPTQGAGLVIFLGDKGRDSLSVLKERTLSQSLKSIVDQISKSSYNELVIY